MMNGQFKVSVLTIILAVSLTRVTFSAGIVEAIESEGSGKILPKIISEPTPVFPASLARAGADGTVVVSFTVDEAGSVRDAEVFSSTVRQLNPYALKAVGNWKFIPGVRDGHTAPFHLRASVDFSQKIGSPSSQYNVATVTPAVAPAPISPAASAAPKNDNAPLQISALPLAGSVAADVLPAPKRKPVPVYPYDMLIGGRSGWADASFVVDYIGRPLFTNPAGASDRRFALSVVAMVEASEFSPGKKGRVRVMTSLKEHYEFSGEKSLDAEARHVLTELRKTKPAIFSMTELDERPKLIQQISPIYPRALKDDGLTGQAEIEFVVDKDGRVLFPRIVSASHEDFGWAAATAVSQWRYQPPQRDGHNVEVRLSVPILFTAQKLAESD